MEVKWDSSVSIIVFVCFLRMGLRYTSEWQIEGTISQAEFRLISKKRRFEMQFERQLIANNLHKFELKHLMHCRPCRQWNRDWRIMRDLLLSEL